jgi:predicted nucleic acid-binding protein
LYLHEIEPGSKIFVDANDSLTVKIMEEHGISSIASNDLDFKRVAWLNLYLPVPLNNVS